MLCKVKNTKHKKLRRFLIILIVLCLAIVAVFEAQAIPFTRKCVKKQSKAISTQIISESIEKIQNKIGYTYSDLAQIKYNDNGKISAISENSVFVNKLKSKVTREIQNQLDKQKLYGFKLPLGAFTDITMLSTLGPDIEISFILTGSVNCKLKSTFESGGVNQTIHHIKLIFTTDIITISPEYSEEHRFTTDYEIAQTVIVGETPSTFADIVR